MGTTPAVNSTYTQPRSSLKSPDPLSFWSLPPYGGEGGYSIEGDVLVNTTADGVDLNTIWAEVAAVVKAWNAERSALTSLLTFNTVNTADAIPQSRSIDSFEEASEFGEPQSLRPPSEYALMGYAFKDYDRASRWTWKYLRDATAEQVRSVLNYALEADSRLTTGTILQRLFTPTAVVNEWSHTVYGLYNGDTMVPPAFLGRDFTAPHTHYLVSNNDVLDSSDLDDAVKTVTEHGFGTEPSSKLLAIMSPELAEVVSTFKAGEENNNSAIAKHDYIPSAGSPPWLTPDNIQGTVAPAEYNGLKVQGSYGDTWIIQTDFVPADYVVVVATYGPNSASNALGFREHTNALYRGFRIIPGAVPGYPIQDSFYARAFGVGTRRRGQAAVVQVKESGDYEVPSVPK
jgi:hypothetical protein